MIAPLLVPQPSLPPPSGPRSFFSSVPEGPARIGHAPRDANRPPSPHPSRTRTRQPTPNNDALVARLSQPARARNTSRSSQRRRRVSPLPRVSLCRALAFLRSHVRHVCRDLLHPSYPPAVPFSSLPILLSRTCPFISIYSPVCASALSPPFPHFPTFRPLRVAIPRRD